MVLHYVDLNDAVRDQMAMEVQSDTENGSLYISSRLNTLGQDQYPGLLIEAACSHDDDWLATQLRRSGLLAQTEPQKKRGGGTTTAKVPVTAAQTLAEGEFNRFYLRGLCLHAIATGSATVQVYRGKEVRNPRPDSVHWINRRIDAQEWLSALRQGFENVDLPRPNTGLTARL